MVNSVKAHLAFHRFHLCGKQGETIDIGSVLMALNLRKLEKHMKEKVSKIRKISLILTLRIKTRLIISLVDDCPNIAYLFSNK